MATLPGKKCYWPGRGAGGRESYPALFACFPGYFSYVCVHASKNGPSWVALYYNTHFILNMALILKGNRIAIRKRRKFRQSLTLGLVWAVYVPMCIEFFF